MKWSSFPGATKSPIGEKKNHKKKNKTKKFAGLTVFHGLTLQRFLLRSRERNQNVEGQQILMVKYEQMLWAMGELHKAGAESSRRFAQGSFSQREIQW